MDCKQLLLLLVTITTTDAFPYVNPNNMAFYAHVLDLDMPPNMNYGYLPYGNRGGQQPAAGYGQQQNKMGQQHQQTATGYKQQQYVLGQGQQGGPTALEQLQYLIAQQAAAEYGPLQGILGYDPAQNLMVQQPKQMVPGYGQQLKPMGQSTMTGYRQQQNTMGQTTTTGYGPQQKTKGQSTMTGYGQQHNTLGQSTVKGYGRQQSTVGQSTMTGYGQQQNTVGQSTMMGYGQQQGWMGQYHQPQQTGSYIRPRGSQVYSVLERLDLI